MSITAFAPGCKLTVSQGTQPQRGGLPQPRPTAWVNGVFLIPSPEGAMYGARRSVPYIALIKFNPVALEQPPILLLEGHGTVVCFLLLDVTVAKLAWTFSRTGDKTRGSRCLIVASFERYVGPSLHVIPAKAGIHSASLQERAAYELDSRLRGNDL